jgi:mono/diheme cytochrome c family protein
MIKLIVLFVIYGLVIGLKPQPAWAEPGDPVKGKATYERLCVTCHGAQGKGDGPASKMLTPPPADLSSPKIKNKPDGDLLQAIQNGRPPATMPAFKGQLSEQQIHDVLAFVRSLSR